MTNLGSVMRTAEEPRPAPTLAHRAKTNGHNSPQLLELRTETGAVYVRPTRWQRIRLQWTFRHFHVLPPQVLSRSDQRLIEKLSHSAVVTPSLPVASDDVFGVVEKAPSKRPASANRVIPLRRELALTPVPADSKYMKGPSAEPRRSNVPPAPWRALGALAAVGIAVIGAQVYVRPLFLTPRPTRPIEHAATAVKPPDLQPAAASPHPVPAAAASLLSPEKPKLRIPAPPAEPTPVHHEPSSLAASSPAVTPVQTLRPRATNPAPASATVPDTNPVHANPVPVLSALPAPSERRFVSELPPGHFAHPVVSDPNLVGELQLKALIGADGSVKEVTVLSGNPGLAEAGMRAVRQWHYSPYHVLGSPVEVETRIKMNFFGGDAVSIGSVANGTGSQSR